MKHDAVHLVTDYAYPDAGLIVHVRQLCIANCSQKANRPEFSTMILSY